MKLIFALTVSNAEATNAERLLDFIHHRGGRHGDLLLGLYPDVHDEMKARIRISAALAFSTVHELEIRPLADPKSPPFALVNSAFQQVATHVGQSFKWPFLWLESDCTPTASNWRQKIHVAYDEQPYPFFGNRMKVKPAGEKAQEVFFMARVGVYPQNTSSLMVANTPIPFEIASSKTTQGRMGVTKLFQPIKINSDADLISVRDDAILVHGDRNGLLMKQISETPDTDEIPVPVKIEVARPKVLDPIPVIGRPTRAHLETIKRNGVRS